MLRRSGRQTAICALVGVLAAGCSSDFTRFGEGTEFTGSTPNQQAILAQNQPAQPSFEQISGASGAAGVNGQTLPPPQTASATPGTLGQLVDSTTTGSIGQPNAAGAVPGAVSYKGWSTTGGTSITVLQGDTLAGLAQRYNIPPEAFARVNGLPENAALQPGSRVVVPVYSIENAQDTGVPAGAAGEAVAVTPKSRPKQIAALGNDASSTNSATDGTVAESVASPRPEANSRSANAPAAEAAPASSSTTPQFRWPARGRVIAGYGAAVKSGKNDGINIMLPEGASIRASEGGQVIYAGSEIKNFGNLVLVSHANGYVTAYAHASEILVNRGDKVERGQVIARAGTTGSVDQPQLHFELRKGSSPIDPMPYLGEG